MKHLVLTLLGLLSFCLAIRAEVYSGECGDNGNNLTWTLDTETGKLVISGNGAMTQNPWRDYRNYIRIVDIQEGVTSIVSDAFADCSNLTNVIIAESVTTINYYAFYNCKSLNNITIPDNVTYIGSSAFQGCTNLSNITIACTTIASYAFQECTNLKKVTIKNGVKEIKKGAFDNCTSIEKVIVEDGEETLTLGAGGGYNKGLFHNSPIKNLYIGRNLEYNTTSDYGYSPFYALRTIVSLNIGSQVSLLKDNAFNNCTNLNSITCQNSNPPICGTNTFTSVITSTCKLSVPKSSIKTYKSTKTGSDFKNIVELKVISGTCGTNLTWELTPMGELIIEGKGDMSNFMDYNTPWFDYRTSIEKISIGEGVTSIGNWAFYNCNNIESIDLSKDLTHIGNYAFRNCALISAISLPEKLSSIGDGAFDGCSGLTSVTIPNSVTSIGYGAFLSCSDLTSVTIGSGVKTIGSKIFDNCQKLLDVYCLAEKVPSTDSYAFSSSIYSNATLHVPAASIESYKTTEPWSSFCNIVALPNQYELSVSSAGYATLCLSFNAEIPQDVEVYVAEKVDGDCLKMKKVEGVLPAMTGVIVKAETGTYAFIQSEDTSAEIEENLLVGSVIEKEITAEENTSYYILAAPDDNVGMYLVEMVDGAFVCKGNKAYLPISSSGSSAPARIRFDFGTETGVSEVKGKNENVKTEIYDLSGRKVENAQKGIFIVNGKKVVK